MRGVADFAVTAKATAQPDADALPHDLMPSAHTPSTAGVDGVVASEIAGTRDDLDASFPFELFEDTGRAPDPAERWIDPYPGGTALSAATPPTDLPVGALRRRGLTRSTK